MGHDFQDRHDTGIEESKQRRSIHQILTEWGTPPSDESLIESGYSQSYLEGFLGETEYADSNYPYHIPLFNMYKKFEYSFLTLQHEQSSVWIYRIFNDIKVLFGGIEQSFFDTLYEILGIMYHYIGDDDNAVNSFLHAINEYDSRIASVFLNRLYYYNSPYRRKPHPPIEDPLDFYSQLYISLSNEEKQDGLNRIESVRKSHNSGLSSNEIGEKLHDLLDWLFSKCSCLAKKKEYSVRGVKKRLDLLLRLKFKGPVQFSLGQIIIVESKNWKKASESRNWYRQLREYYDRCRQIWESDYSTTFPGKIAVMATYTEQKDNPKTIAEGHIMDARERVYFVQLSLNDIERCILENTGPLYIILEKVLELENKVDPFANSYETRSST